MAETTVSEVQQSPSKAAEGVKPADEMPVPNGVHAEEELEEQTTPNEPSEPTPAHQSAAEEEASEQTAAPVEAHEPETPSEQPASEPEAAAEEPEVEAEANTISTQPEAAAPAAPVAREDLPIWRKRLWFVRMPKPLEEGSSLSSEHEMESYRTQVAILNESLNVKRMERDAASEATQAAQVDFNAVREHYEAKKAEAEPHRARRKSLREAAAQLQAEFKADYGDLPAKSETELDAMVADTHHRMTHGESMPLAEEKKCLQHIKKLEAAREKVREYGAKAAGVREARAAAAAASSGSGDLEAEVQALFDELSTQRAILDRYRAEESEVRAELKKISDERQRVKALQDEAYGRIVGARNEKRDKSRVWGDNRRFSQQIRQVLARGEGALEEARRQCDAQMDEAHALLRSDDVFRVEYFKLWEGQRKGPTSPYSDAETVDVLAGGRGGKGGGRSSTGGGAAAAPADDGSKTRAEAIIAAALAQASETVERANKMKAESEAKAAAAAAPDSSSGNSNSEMAAVAASAAAAAAVGNAPAAPSPPPKKHVRKSSKASAPAVVLLPEVDDRFELPSLAKKQESAPFDAESEKQRIREQNRAAAAEAERRKDRQRKAAEEKRRTAEARRVRDTQAKRSSPASNSPATSEADAPASAAAALTATASGDLGSAAPALGGGSSDEAPPSSRLGGGAGGGGGSSKPASGKRIVPKDVPRARAPVKKKNAAVRLLQRLAAKTDAGAQAAWDVVQPWAKQNPVPAGGILGGVTLLVLLFLFRLFV